MPLRPLWCHCNDFAYQTRGIYQVMPYSVDFKALKSTEQDSTKQMQF